MRLKIIRAGAEIRRSKGLPPENNITVLYNETAPLFGIEPKPLLSTDADHLPSPDEMTDEEGKSIIPNKDCPECGRKESMILGSVCAKCKDSEGGKYRSMWCCGKLGRDRKIVPGTGCGFKEKSEKVMVQQMDEMGIDYQNKSKKELGIKTYTDEGLKDSEAPLRRQVSNPIQLTKCPKCNKDTLSSRYLCCSESERGRYRVIHKCISEGCDYEVKSEGSPTVTKRNAEARIIL